MPIISPLSSSRLGIRTSWHGQTAAATKESGQHTKSTQTHSAIFLNAPDCWSSESVKSVFKSSPIPQSLSQGADTQSHQNDRWRYNHPLTLLTENRTGRNAWVSSIDHAFLGAGYARELSLWQFSFVRSGRLSFRLLHHDSDLLAGSRRREWNRLRGKGFC